jgi:Heterokaryon incompatibility protein (HET)
LTIIDTDDLQQAVQLGGHLMSDPISDQSTYIMRKWLERCHNNHPECRIIGSRPGEEERPTLPTRLIEVGSNGDKEVKISLTYGLFGKFAALSHRWTAGKTPNWVTTTSNVKERCKGLDVKDLPKSIQDAIKVTRKLTLQYLWVDSLCILQDSAVDWDIESSKMVNVYSEAYITLFADRARDDEEGFLGPRTFQDNEPLTLSLRIQPGHDKTLPVLIRTPAMYSYSAHDFNHTVEKSILSERGWILQERLMSRRILHFGSEQTCWECRATVDQEDGMVTNGRREWLTGAHNALKKASSDDNYWRQVVEAYSRRQLTQHIDKLPALSGIANAISAVREGDVYLAGLWKNSLLFDLTWRTEQGKWDDGDVKIMKPSDYRAPSWSWASIDGPIEHKYCLENAESGHVTAAFDILEGKVVPMGHNPFGQVRHGFLKLSGFLLEAICLGPITRWDIPLYHEGTPLGNFHPDTKEDVLVISVTCLKLLDFGSIWDEVFLVLVPAGGAFKRIGLGDTRLGDGSRYYTESVFESKAKQLITLI